MQNQKVLRGAYLLTDHDVHHLGDIHNFYKFGLELIHTKTLKPFQRIKKLGRSNIQTAL